MALKALTIAVTLVIAAAYPAFADHERFIVGAMQNVDPSGEIITSTSGSCVPSHDREKLECYFTSFGLWKTRKDEDRKKDFDGLLKEIEADPAKYTAEMKKSFCGDKKVMQSDPKYLKYNVWANRDFTAIKAFCERPTRDALLAVFRAMDEHDAVKCRCVVTDWRSTLVRQGDRWVENSGPNGLCGVIKVFTLVPYEIKKMKDPTGPILWTLHEKTVTTHGSDNKLCAQSLFKVTDDSLTVSWNAPTKTIECQELDFSSGLDGMSNPRQR
jgi:hypothetical protein